MLRTIQIIAIVQGLFLLLILFRNKSNYKKTTFWLFTGSIISILLFLIGDDDNNIFAKGADWFLLDNFLFITFLFLFFKYFKMEKEQFDRKDLWFFFPNVLYLIVESIEVLQIEENLVIEIIENLVEFTFLAYLVYILIDLFKNKSKHWILYLTLPVTVYFTLDYLIEILEFIGYNETLLSNSIGYSSYFLVMAAFLFYGMTFYLINNPKELLPIRKRQKYKGSKLSNTQVEDYKTALNHAMNNKKVYRDPKLSIHKLSEELAIPRQYISEVLNIHMGKSFQDFVNEYRVEAFIKKLEKDQNDHFTLFGLANEVGFNSKSTFNAIFKKYKGLTPSQFKKSLPKSEQVCPS